MVMYEEGPYNSIKDYYKQVDTLEKINSDNISYYREVFQKQAINLHDTDKKRIELELDCLNFLTRNGQIEPRYTRKTKNGDVESYPSLSSITDDDINYLKTRIENIRNIYFKTRFAHIIWIKSKQYEYAKQTVDCYFLLTENCRNLDKAVPSDYFGMEICNAL